ncbi:MAG: putative toxin-antitoxin system toxin component, PIN family [Rhodospirillales bacterium]|nr:putative toxin-antitoxin system toxin component, PIN family [Rhodospirillales bacterium]
MTDVAVVFDTNVLVSAALFAASKPSLAVRWAATNDLILASVATLSELAATMEHRKFDRYASVSSRREFVAYFYATAELVSIRRSVRASRDHKDDKFLEVAVNGKADVLVTGDADLLVLGSYEGISIVAPADYLTKVGG